VRLGIETYGAANAKHFARYGDVNNLLRYPAKIFTKMLARTKLGMLPKPFL
jgi:hypothetical protein